jgi:hypothetical protein
MFDNTQLKIIKYCAEECMRQGSGEKSVYDMLNAWDGASHTFENCTLCPQPLIGGEIHDFTSAKITLDFIRRMGKAVEPEDNKNGFRTIPIFVSNGWERIEKAPFERVPEMLERLIDAYYGNRLYDPYEGHAHHLTRSGEDQFYYEYEQIHPFRDGNGRTGKILYNYLKGTLDNPAMPPNFFNCSNP